MAELHLGRHVDLHDDGSAAGMFDLRVGPADAPDIAIEVTTAIDPVWTETWNVGQKQPTHLRGVDGAWMVELRPGAIVRRVREELPVLLTAMAACRRDKLRTLDDAYHEPVLCGLLGQLGITSVHSLNAAESPGKVYFTLNGFGGAVDTKGSSIPAWVHDFLSDPGRADVLRKLGSTTARCREVFILVTLDGVPWSVGSYLADISRHGVTMPPSAPSLPAPATGVWLASTLAFGESVGVRWDGTKWLPFATRGEGIDDGLPQ